MNIKKKFKEERVQLETDKKRLTKEAAESSLPEGAEIMPKENNWSGAKKA